MHFLKNRMTVNGVDAEPANIFCFYVSQPSLKPETSLHHLTSQITMRKDFIHSDLFSLAGKYCSGKKPTIKTTKVF
jgi:hypothetical protein